MYLRASLLLFSVGLSLSTSFPEYRKPAPYKLNHKKNYKDNSEDSCFCFDNPDSSSLISQVLDPKNHGLERLVVYLYRDPKTRDLKLYTPSIEKQNLIPDLAFEDGDGLIVVRNETVSNFFDNNSNTVALNTNKRNIEKKDPIGLFNGEITTAVGENTPPTKNENIPYINIIEKKNTDSGIKVPPTNYEYNVFGIKEPNNYDTETSPESVYTKRVDNLHPDGNGVNPTQNTRKRGESETEHYYPSPFNYQANINGKSYVTFDKWFDQQMGVFQQLETHDAVNVDILKMLIIKTLHDNNMYVSSDGFLINSHGTVLDMSNLKLRPVLIGDSITYESFLQFTTDKYTLPRNLPYLETILVTLVYPPKILGIIPLGRTYLPPVSPGAAERLDTVIPKPFSKYKTVSTPYCNNGMCYTEKVVGPNYLHSQIEASDGKIIIPDIINPHTIHHEYKEHKTSETPSGTQNKNSAKSYTNTKHEYYKLDEPYVKKILDLKKARRFSIDGLIRTIVSLLSGKSKKEAATNRRGDFKPIFKEVPNKGEPVFGEDDYGEESEIPDFRIIGGNAATSSGTPVNNKGRSGGIA